MTFMKKITAICAALGVVAAVSIASPSTASADTTSPGPGYTCKIWNPLFKHQTFLWFKLPDSIVSGPCLPGNWG